MEEILKDTLVKQTKNIEVLMKALTIQVKAKQPKHGNDIEPGRQVIVHDREGKRTLGTGGRARNAVAGQDDIQVGVESGATVHVHPGGEWDVIEDLSRSVNPKSLNGWQAFCSRKGLCSGCGMSPCKCSGSKAMDKTDAERLIPTLGAGHGTDIHGNRNFWSPGDRAHLMEPNGSHQHFRGHEVEVIGRNDEHPHILNIRLPDGSESWYAPHALRSIGDANTVRRSTAAPRRDGAIVKEDYSKAMTPEEVERRRRRYTQEQDKLRNVRIVPDKKRGYQEEMTREAERGWQEGYDDLIEGKSLEEGFYKALGDPQLPNHGLANGDQVRHSQTGEEGVIQHQLEDNPDWYWMSGQPNPVHRGRLQRLNATGSYEGIKALDPDASKGKKDVARLRNALGDLEEAHPESEEDVKDAKEDIGEGYGDEEGSTTWTKFGRDKFVFRTGRYTYVIYFNNKGSRGRSRKQEEAQFEKQTTQQKEETRKQESKGEVKKEEKSLDNIRIKEIEEDNKHLKNLLTYVRKSFEPSEEFIRREELSPHGKTPYEELAQLNSERGKDIEKREDAVDQGAFYGEGERARLYDQLQRARDIRAKVQEHDYSKAYIKKSVEDRSSNRDMSEGGQVSSRNASDIRSRRVDNPYQASPHIQAAEDASLHALEETHLVNHPEALKHAHDAAIHAEMLKDAERPEHHEELARRANNSHYLARSELSRAASSIEENLSLGRHYQDSDYHSERSSLQQNANEYRRVAKLHDDALASHADVVHHAQRQGQKSMDESHKERPHIDRLQRDLEKLGEEHHQTIERVGRYDKPEDLNNQWNALGEQSLRTQENLAKEEAMGKALLFIVPSGISPTSFKNFLSHQGDIKSCINCVQHHIIRNKALTPEKEREMLENEADAIDNKMDYVEADRVNRPPITHLDNLRRLGRNGFRVVRRINELNNEQDQ